ncbi:hypothetical protein AMTR_s00019p00147310 [Amborella trichopoda]|uniref:Uncharacterized protein n=1 Tax=Amborella trichopoda TaxID=13333 RepID=W1PBA1_AMBTC|nr:hypothetical protein AMTR_s00019p00147310 [Amborella trichopoda]
MPRQRGYSPNSNNGRRRKDSSSPPGQGRAGDSIDRGRPLLQLEDLLTSQLGHRLMKTLGTCHTKRYKLPHHPLIRTRNMDNSSREARYTALRTCILNVSTPMTKHPHGGRGGNGGPTSSTSLAIPKDCGPSEGPLLRPRARKPREFGGTTSQN